MWAAVREQFENVFKRLRGRGLLDEAAVREALRDIRLALLEADVHYTVVKSLIERVKPRALAQEVLQSLSPGQQVLTIVWEELGALMGHSHRAVQLAANPPTVIMLVGLQGAGKTTTAGKIARIFSSSGRRVLLAAADLKRPAAVRQLEVIGQQISVPVYAPGQETTPAAVCRAAVTKADALAMDLVILDTAGRIEVDEALMAELSTVREVVAPHEVLLVADAMTGQSALSIAQQFEQRVGLTGIVLTKTEGDARAGAVLSMLAVTGKPIKYLGTGEALTALERSSDRVRADRRMGCVESWSSGREAFSGDAAIADRSAQTRSLEDWARRSGKLGSLATHGDDPRITSLPAGWRVRRARSQRVEAR
jgi:signal recognition particle subunit SRP54